MVRMTRWLWQLIFVLQQAARSPMHLAPLWMLLASVFAQAGCSCEPEGQAQSNKPLPCVSQRGNRKVFPRIDTATKTIAAGTIPASFGVTDQGDAALTMPLVVPPGRAGVEPTLAISYSSGAGNGLLGMGFAVSGASSITRCPKTKSIDGPDTDTGAVHYDANDAFCLDGKRLVIVAQNGDSIEYRTFPDTQIKIVQHGVKGASYFEAFLPSGWVVEYGKTAETRPLARGGVARAWLAGVTHDARGNAMTYEYCFAEADDYVAEYALEEIKYTGFEGEEGTRAVSFVYGTKNVEDVRNVYSGQMAFQNSLRLDEVQMQLDGRLVRRYAFGYDQSETTKRTRLVLAQECGADGTCKPETRFQYAKTTTGFERVAKKIAAPMSRRASYLLADFNGDGLDDVLTPDTTVLSTPTNPITEWRLTASQGHAFAAPNVAFSQEWSFQQEPQGAADPALLQPELGTAIDFNQDGRMDVLLHDVYGNRNNHIVLRSNENGTFEAIDTGIQRPFPLGPAPKQLRDVGGSVHLADVDGDGVGDLILCEDHGSAGDANPGQSSWTVHLWQLGGFALNGVAIEPLAGLGCDIDMRTVDLNRNARIDLVVPGIIRIGGTPSTHTKTYSALERNADGSWKAWDTHLNIVPTPVRPIFADVNGDGLPDALTYVASEGRMRTWLNTDSVFTTEPTDSVDWQALVASKIYLNLATPLDWDGDGRTDLLVAMGGPPEVPTWYIWHALGGSSKYTFELIPAGIPFEAQLGEAVTLADPRGPRVGDVNGDGAPDILLFVKGELQVFQNQASNPDVLISYSDGLNEHEPDDANFVPNVSIAYDHLIDESITNGAPPNDPKKESILYLSHADSSNTCEYPRRCAVGSRRIVREYATHDGQGGVRRFGLRYRDGRYDRGGYGFLGFGERIVTDLDTNAGTATFHDNTTRVNVGTRDVYALADQVTALWRWAPALPNESNKNRVELAFAENTIGVVPTNGGQTYFTIATKRHSRRMQGTFSAATSLETWVADVAIHENATMLRNTSVDVTNVDAFGQALGVTASTVGVDLSYEITRIVKNDTNRWILGQVQNQTECSKAGLVEQCRLYTYTTNAFGEVESQSRSTSDNIPDTKLMVSYDKRDKYGNVEHVVAKDEFGHVRESTTVFDHEGVYPIKEINALGHETALEYDRRFGLLTKETDPNHLVTEWTYNDFGREALEKRPNGSQTTTTLSRTKLDGVWRLVERETTTGGADDETVFDSRGRAISTFTHGPTPEGKIAPRRMQRLGYDRLNGKIAKRSVLAAEDTPVNELLFDVYEFDSIGREIRHTTPWNATTTTTYTGFVIDSADMAITPARHTLTEVDKAGRPTTIIDPAKGKTTYTYGPFNALRTATDPGGATTTWTLDALARPRTINDPDRGTTTVQHNGFGDVVTSTDALGRVVAFGMDALGRVNARTDKLGAQVATTTWTWDTAPNGLGRLHSVASPDALQSFSYTTKGQLQGMTQSVSGESFVTRQQYDDVGRVKSIDYPQPLGEEPFGVTYTHDEHGYVVGVREKNTLEAFWTLEEVDEAGRIQKERLGNNIATTRTYYRDKQTVQGISTTVGAKDIQQLAYDYDAQLNLKSRTDALQLQNTTERFRYDELDRVTCAYFGSVENAQVPCATSYAYMANGNVWEKSDIGTYSYLDAKHPHAVTHVVPGETYSYDAVGNQITRPGGTSLSYTAFDLPKTILQGGKTTSFGYDGEQQRIRKSSPVAETLYVGVIFEQVTSIAGVIERRYYVFSPERAIAVVTRGGASPGTRFLLVDHLGSIETVTKQDGTVDERRSNDAFGARRNPQWGGPPGAFTSKTTRGFTGHEEDDDIGLVNAKGRMYDARLGRFTTTDVVIADVWNGQSLNRYGYVLNNPLAFVDPTGFVPEEPDHWAPGRWTTKVITEPQLPTGEIVVGSSTVRDTASAPEPEKAKQVNAYTPPVDLNTTGNGAQGLPRETPPTEPAPSRPGLWDGVWDGLNDLGDHLDEMVPGSWADKVATLRTLVDVYDAYRQGDVVDAINVVNPMMSVARLGFAIDEDDWYTVGQQAVGVGVAILSMVVARKVTGIGKGAKTARGPPSPNANGMSGGPRAGKPFTRKTKADAIARNAEAHGGQTTCMNCGQPTIPAKQSTKGVTPPTNETQVDHKIPRILGGDGSSENADIFCRLCNGTKGAKHPWP